MEAQKIPLDLIEELMKLLIENLSKIYVWLEIQALNQTDIWYLWMSEFI